MLPSEISLDLVYDTLKELKDEVASNMLDSLIGKRAASIDDLGSVSLHRLRTEDSVPFILWFSTYDYFVVNSDGDGALDPMEDIDLDEFFREIQDGRGARLPSLPAPPVTVETKEEEETMRWLEEAPPLRLADTT